MIRKEDVDGDSHTNYEEFVKSFKIIFIKISYGFNLHNLF